MLERLGHALHYLQLQVNILQRFSLNMAYLLEELK